MHCEATISLPAIASESVPPQLVGAERMSAEELLTMAFAHWGRSLVLLTALQAEGIVLLDLCRQIFPELRVMTIDTGRLPEETHAFINEVERWCGIRIEIIYPNAQELQRLAARQGSNGFRRGREQRELCCQVRKVRPWQAMIESHFGMDSGAGRHETRIQTPRIQAWISGLRREQSSARGEITKLQPDSSAAGVWKVAPLADWSGEQVEAYRRRRQLPHHPLYADGYTSIGCAPCTRALAAGESQRDGRWWWERGGKECGLHSQTATAINVSLRELLG